MRRDSQRQACQPPSMRSTTTGSGCTVQPRKLQAGRDAGLLTHTPVVESISGCLQFERKETALCLSGNCLSFEFVAVLIQAKHFPFAKPLPYGVDRPATQLQNHAQLVCRWLLFVSATWVLDRGETSFWGTALPVIFFRSVGGDKGNVEVLLYILGHIT